jgi:hypothetical protein
MLRLFAKVVPLWELILLIQPEEMSAIMTYVSSLIRDQLIISLAGSVPPEL